MLTDKTIRTYTTGKNPESLENVR